MASIAERRPFVRGRELLVALALCSAVLSSAPLLAQGRSDQAWVESTLAGLSLEQKAAQLVFVRTYGRPSHSDSWERRELLAMVRDLGVGGLVVFQSEVGTLPRLLDELQQAAELPLLVTADFENGAYFRIPDGPVSFPSAMAVGATRDEGAARFMGEITAREGRALGVHWTFAPVADVNNNPENPIINLRSFGEQPELVSRMVRAYVEGAHAEGMLTTAKHFPGHGDTAIDSHVAQPVLEVSRERLEEVELQPFRRAIEAGVDSIMTGHLVVPALDSSGAPATLSLPVGRLLRDGLGFDGLIVTDAIEMRGVKPAWTGEAVVRAINAGADVALLPSDPRVAVQSIVRAVAEGQLDEARIDRSVRRLLETKARLGLHRDRRVDPAAVEERLGRSQDQARADEIARSSITVLRNREAVLPLAAEEPLKVLHLVVSGRPMTRPLGAIPRAELRRRGVEAETLVLGSDVSPETEVRVIEAAAEASHVLVSAYVRVARDPEQAELSPSVAALIERLARGEAPVVTVSYGSPWLVSELPSVQAFVAAYGFADASQRAAMAGLFGEVTLEGKLPVTVPGLYPFGHGVEIPRREMTLQRVAPESVGFRPGAMAEVDRVVEGFVEQGAFPGATLAVGHRGGLAHLEAYGRMTYDDDATLVEADTIYDLASLTKVVATTTMAMILVDEGRLDIDKPVQDFLPLFQGEGKEAVTVRHLLTHSSGLPSGAPLFQELEGRQAFLDHIQGVALEYEPDSESVYSDFGMILLGEILERVAGEPIETFVERRVFAPLGMKDTGFLPAPELRPRIAPTEVDAWRGYTVHGEVHDENTHAMGGVAGHAGLFSTAPDLARWAQMLLNGGVFEHRRIVSRETIETFRKRVGLPESTRALGFDTRSAEGSSAGEWFSPDSYGHLGFTGTSIWIDPQRELFVILLTNRVHPTRENILIREARPAVANAVVEGLVESPVPAAVGQD